MNCSTAAPGRESFGQLRRRQARAVGRQASSVHAALTASRARGGARAHRLERRSADAPPLSSRWAVALGLRRRGDRRRSVRGRVRSTPAPSPPAHPRRAEHAGRRRGRASVVASARRRTDTPSDEH
eukprot:scaffold181972_cov33-Tisochrysis_lutea.AAC.1